MKKIIIAAVALLVLAGAGGAWYWRSHAGDPVAKAKAMLASGDTRGAGLQLRIAVRDNPSNAEAHAMLAGLQVMQGDGVAAEKEIKTARSLGWDKNKTLEVLAQAYDFEGKWQDLLAEIPAQGITPDETASFLMARAVAERALGHLDEAKTDIVGAEQAAPKNTAVWVMAAQIALSDKDSVLALKDLDQALAINPKSVDALDMKAQLRAASGQRDEAVALLDQAVSVAPSLAGLRLERATLLMSLGKDDEASADVAAVRKQDPKNAVANYIQMVLLVRRGKFAEANTVEQDLDTVINQFQRGLYFRAMIKGTIGETETAEDSIKTYMARNPQDQEGLHLLARIALAARRPQDALPALKTAVANGSRDPDTLNLLGRAYALAGDRSNSEAAFQQASSAVANSPDALTRLASSRLQVGDLSGAATDLERSLEMAPKTPGAGEALVAAALGVGDVDRAQAALDQLKQQTGYTETVGILSGLIKEARIDLEGALQTFKETADKYPDSIRARMSEAKVLLEMGRPADAVAPLQEILAKDKANTEALSMLINILIQQKRGPEAIAAVQAARATNPSNPGFIVGEAEMYERLGDLNKAMEVLDAAKVQGNTPVPLLPILARIQLAAGQNDAAKATIATLVRSEPTNISARVAQIQILTRLKDYAAARDATDDALRRFPGNISVMGLMLANERADKGPEAALALANKLRADPANMPAAAVLKGDEYIQQRRYADAADAFAAEYKAEPSSVLVRRLAVALQFAGSVDKGEQELKNWQALHPSDPDVAQLLSTIELTKHENNDAEHDIRTVLEQRPNDPVALNNMAWLLQVKGDKAARSFATRAYLQNPNPESADTLGWIMVTNGDAAHALPLLQRALAGRPQSATLAYHLAVALKDVGRKDDAVALLKQLTADNVTFEEKPEATQLLANLSK